MRSVDALALLACGLLAGSALAHGVHDLRGEARVDGDCLVVIVEGQAAHAEPERCLRLLNELVVRGSDGSRLVGSESTDPATQACRLEFPLDAETAALTLSLRPGRASAERHERLVLATDEPGDGRPPVLVLGPRDEPQRLAAGR